MAVNLDDFPTSEAAKRLLSHVTAGWYDRSYVGKWIYQVQGMEIDRAEAYVKSLPYQFFPETATWGLAFHEMKWGLPVREGRPYGERRQMIYQKRDRRMPMTPYWMEVYIENATGIRVEVADANEPGGHGFSAPHPNVFEVYTAGCTETDIRRVREILDRIKQSHTTYTLYENPHNAGIYFGSFMEEADILELRQRQV